MWITNKKHIHYVHIAQKSSVPSSAAAIWITNCTDVHMDIPVHVYILHNHAVMSLY